MAYDLRANQVRLNRIISSGSIPILIYPSSSAADLAGNLAPSFSTAAIGSDVFLYVSGSSTAKSVFGGDVITSGSFRSFSGITGSVQYTDASSTPFIIAGPNITASYNSLGQWEISGSTPVSYFTSPSNGVVQTTGSLLAVSLSSSNGAQVTGSLEVRGGITGSIRKTIAGDDFIIAGPGATVNYNSLGQWVITSSVVGSDYWVSTTNKVVYTTGSAYATTLSASAGAIITGSLTQGTGILEVGTNSHAEGDGSKAYAPSSHAEGSNTTTHIGADWSHAEGTNTHTKKQYAHAEGNTTTAEGAGSHAEGYYTWAYGNYSHAEGYYTTASADYSHAGGEHTQTGKTYQTAVGSYNIINNTTSLFVVGDGNNTTPHDVLRVEQGNVQVTGSLISPQITGSIQYVSNTTPFIVGSGVTVNYNSSGQYAITGSGGYTNYTKTISGDGSNLGSGSISGFFNGLVGGQVGKYEVQFVAIDSIGADSAAWKFSVSAFSSSLNTFSLIGHNELTFDHTANAASWDVNFSDISSDSIGLTGSTGTTYFYAQVTAKMVLSQSGGIVV